MATINARQRFNVPKQGHVQGRTIKGLGLTTKRSKTKITHTPNRMNPKEKGTKVCKPYKSRRKKQWWQPTRKAKNPNHKHLISKITNKQTKPSMCESSSYEKTRLQMRSQTPIRKRPRRNQILPHYCCVFACLFCLFKPIKVPHV